MIPGPAGPRSAGPRSAWHDSAGVPWQGRTLSPTGFESDEGAVPPRLAAALTAHACGRGDLADVVAALAGERLLVPVVAVSGESEPGTSAQMALVTLTAPDGRRALPAFTSTAAMAAWDGAARPVPVESRRAALSAVDEGCELLVLDPGTTSLLLPRPALWALARGEHWVPPYQRADVAAALARCAAGVPAVSAVRPERGRTAELAVVLSVRPGLDQDAVAALTDQVAAALAREQVVADRVDSIELRLVPAG